MSVQVSQSAIVARIRRKLRPKYERLCRSDGRGWNAVNYGARGEFYIHDWRRNNITAAHIDDIEGYARELGVLAPHESMIAA